jgi:hypothetical protein
MRKRQSKPASPATPSAAAQEVIILGAPDEPASPAHGGEPPGGGERLWDELRRPLTAAFAFALLVGIIAVLTRNTGLAVLAIFGYFLFGIRLPKSERNTERFADSLYYLGFIFTLGALFVAMTPLFNKVGGVDE